MTSDFRPERYFADALEGRRDITDTYHVLGDIPDLVGLSADNEDEFISQIRRLIDAEGGGTKGIEEIASDSVQNAANLYLSNHIAAVDGTDAVSSLRFASDTIYAAGSILVTPQTHNQPRAHVTRTRASHLTPSQNQGATWTQALTQWANYLRGARDQELSWINTFREYEEREVALGWLKENPNNFALIDGPILTQNMLTQEQARNLLQELVQHSRAIGFIKDISANPLVSAIGYALRPGEVFILKEWTNILADRFQRGQQNIAEWIKQNGKEVVRAVYKVNRKAFAVECLAQNVSLAMAILRHDGGGTLNHDIPLILQIADNHVRTTFNGARARDEVLARFASGNAGRLLEMTNERSLR